MSSTEARRQARPSIEQPLQPEDLEEFIPLEHAFSSPEQLQDNCAGTGFHVSPSNEFVRLEEFRALAVDFYGSGAPKLAPGSYAEQIMNVVLQHDRRIAAVCPLAVLQALLLRSEMLMLGVYTNSAQSQDLHALHFSEASKKNLQYTALEQWIKSVLGGPLPDLGWPLAKGWGRMMRYYDLLWTDVYDSEDAWAVMEQPGQISDDQYHDALADVAKVLGGLGVEWWPCRGTLIALLRHGGRSGRLSRGLVDVVERDIDVMLGVHDEEDWEQTGRAIERGLLEAGWDRCWTKPSADLSSDYRYAVRRDLLYCVRLKPAYVLLDITSYIAGAEVPYVFVHRVCEEPGVSDALADGGVVAGDGCAAPVRTGPLQHGGGVLLKDAIHPMGRCRAAGMSISCPNKPLDTVQAMVHSGLDAGCIALPTAKGREAEDPWTRRLQVEGLRAEDVRILRERSQRLDALGFQSMTPFFESCVGLENIIAEGDVQNFT
ncbi:unnamed protein product [Polarella glacialis]|nr:unnamed protein product [Polarella glacialis]